MIGTTTKHKQQQRQQTTAKKKRRKFKSHKRQVPHVYSLFGQSTLSHRVPLRVKFHGLGNSDESSKSR